MLLVQLLFEAERLVGCASSRECVVLQHPLCCSNPVCLCGLCLTTVARLAGWLAGVNSSSSTLVCTLSVAFTGGADWRGVRGMVGAWRG